MSPTVTSKIFPLPLGNLSLWSHCSGPPLRSPRKGAEKLGSGCMWGAVQLPHLDQGRLACSQRVLSNAATFFLPQVLPTHPCCHEDRSDWAEPVWPGSLLPPEEGRLWGRRRVHCPRQEWESGPPGWVGGLGAGNGGIPEGRQQWMGQKPAGSCGGAVGVPGDLLPT